MAHCDLNMLINAAFTAYSIVGDKSIKESEQRDAILDAGFGIYQTRMVTKNPDNTYLNKLTAVCFAPPDTEHGPIVIAYRGTADEKDISADAQLTATGVVDKQYRDQAYAFYLEMKQQHPNREIILTGHSLGGNLAQYVGAKSYSESLLKGEEPSSLFVRTFNSASIQTNHGNIFKTEAGAKYEKNFVNYRLEYDIVSNASMQKSYYGNMYTFLIKNPEQPDPNKITGFLQKARNIVSSAVRTISAPFKKTVEAHFLTTMIQHIPDYVKKQTIGTTYHKTADQSSLEELIKCSLCAYEVRIAGQLFAGLRQGSVNLAKIKEHEAKILKAFEAQSFHEASALLTVLSTQVSGKKSKELVQTLLNHVADHNARTFVRDLAPKFERPGLDRSHSSHSMHNVTALSSGAFGHMAKNEPETKRRNSIG